VLLVIVGFVILGSGYGMHEPWPPDSPRFAAVARDMLATGDWLFPRVGGDLYADKPPVFFWLMAGAIWLTGSVKAGFLLPSLLAGIGTLWLVYDLSRRLWDSRVATAAALSLLATIQFALQAHTAQIDGTLCFFTTLGLYGFLRHLLAGPDWRWYTIGGAACGIGVITKGVGFLPFLVFLPWLMLRRRGKITGPAGSALQWSGAPLAALAVIALWLVPVLLASLGDPALAAYRNEILFGQTVERYVAAEGHRKPVWYLFTNAIPWLWLPLSLTLPWLVPHWRNAWRRGDGTVILPLFWALLVLAFFTLSTGKRGVYIYPALPALVLSAAPFIGSVIRERWPNYLATGAMAAIAALTAFICLRFPELLAGHELAANPGLLPTLRWSAGALSLLAAVCATPWPGNTPSLVRFAIFLAGAGLFVGWQAMPALDDLRSGAPIMAAARQAMPPGGELGITRPKETLILHAGGALTNFGHRRPDRDQELSDAALWLTADPLRRLILPEEVLQPCFSQGVPVKLGHAHRTQWLLVDRGAVTQGCAAKGRIDGAIDYQAPASLPSLF
jgi:4-amino-4-deoxy-L-arabinose transferase-like glycosyltransferase